MVYLMLCDQDTSFLSLNPKRQLYWIASRLFSLASQSMSRKQNVRLMPLYICSSQYLPSIPNLTPVMQQWPTQRMALPSWNWSSSGAHVQISGFQSQLVNASSCRTTLNTSSSLSSYQAHCHHFPLPLSKLTMLLFCKENYSQEEKFPHHPFLLHLNPRPSTTSLHFHFRGKAGKVNPPVSPRPHPPTHSGFLLRWLLFISPTGLSLPCYCLPSPFLHAQEPLPL